jgi:hypothetical protein
MARPIYKLDMDIEIEIEIFVHVNQSIDMYG